MDLPKGSTWKTEAELNRYLVNNYPSVNHNLMRLAIYLQSMGTSLNEVMKKAEPPGCPFLKIADR